MFFYVPNCIHTYISILVNHARVFNVNIFLHVHFGLDVLSHKWYDRNTKIITLFVCLTY